MAINKVITADEAVAGVKDGMTIMIGGFLGTGSPEIIMDALVRKGVNISRSSATMADLRRVSLQTARAKPRGGSASCSIIIWSITS